MNPAINTMLEWERRSHDQRRHDWYYEDWERPETPPAGKRPGVVMWLLGRLGRARADKRTRECGDACCAEAG
jgi:hypothetical protein